MVENSWCLREKPSRQRIRKVNGGSGTEGKIERDEQDGGVQFLEGCRTETTGISGSISVTMAGKYL